MFMQLLPQQSDSVQNKTGKYSMDLHLSVIVVNFTPCVETPLLHSIVKDMLKPARTLI